MSMPTEGIFKFGEFEIDALARTLRREETIVTLNRRAFDVLLYLVQNPGKVVTRDELLKNVWSDTFVDENSLAQSISALRRALDEKPGDNSYIVTLPGRGYQFVSPVQVVATEKLSIVADMATADSHVSRGLLFQERTVRTSVVTEEKQQLSLPVSRNRAGARLLVAFAMAVIALAGFYVWTRFHRAQPPPNSAAGSSIMTPLAARRSIAVLGFRNLSGRPEEGWLSTALSEMLSTELEAGEKLRLISGEDVARTKLDLPLADADSLSRETLARLHKDLDSDLIVLGSYTALGEKPGTRIRLDLRLQDTVAGETIADVAVVGSEADLFDMASQAGSRLREKLGVEAISPVEAVSVRASSPSNREAARLYSEGLARLHVFDALEARDLLQQAVAADSKFSLAHSALAEAWSRLGYDKKAQQEARQAYDLSANLSREERLVVEGRYRDIDHEYEKAIGVYRALFTLFPDNVDYGLKLAAVQTRGGKGHDALATVESLRKLAPPASDDPRIEFAEVQAWNLLGDSVHKEQPLARAVEKAKAQGSRLVLAEAREMQCGFWRDFRSTTENAVAACREARDIFAAAGDQEGEARSLRIWADVAFQTDVPESIRLFHQAQTIFNRNGSEADVANVLNNLGNVYELQGDPATAEKMLRQAVAIFQRIDDKKNMITAIGNLADDRLDLGDLRGAMQLYEEGRQDRDPADTAYAALAGDNIAIVHQLQGDLEEAKHGFEQSLATWQKSGDPNSAYALWGLGSVLFQEADFSGARKMYEQALAIRTSARDEFTIAETQVGIADLSLEEAHSPVEQEAAMRQVIEVFQKRKAPDDETLAGCVLARALLVEGKAAAAADAVQHARSLAAKSQNPEIRWRTAIAAARINTAEKDAARSAAGSAMRKELTTIIAKSRELGYQGIELDARLAFAEIEMKAGQTTTGRAHLAAVEADAKAKGYNLIARKAALARG
jgi:DNA-binding winged helix-turn-helix (wHTH) protein/tetratricopeptide (TPR) repeat protein/TolB-like protein